MGVDVVSTRRAIFLDRDGVLNRPVERDGVSGPPASLAELELLPGVTDACARLRDAGYLLVIVTNQPDVRRGTMVQADVEAVNAAVLAAVAADDVRTCFHDDGDGCGCRKPRPGMLRAAAEEWNIDLTASYMVGDRWKDVEAGQAAGCTTVLIERAEPYAGSTAAWRRADSLTTAAAIILGGDGEGEARAR